MISLPDTPSFSLEGKRVLVVGASSGIGLGIAVAAARAGGEVVCAARRVNMLTDLTNAMKKENLKCSHCFLDITNVGEMKDILNDLKTFDVVINSSGIARHGPSLNTIEEDFEAVMQANLKGAYFLSTYSAKLMIESKTKGSIIHISSQMGHIGGQERSVYCASKHGVEGMIKSMAIEWGEHSIRINSIAPTFIVTALTESSLKRKDIKDWVTQKIKLPYLGKVEDVMGAAIYLASDASSMVTGTSILVDGGWTAG